MRYLTPIAPDPAAWTEVVGTNNTILDCSDPTMISCREGVSSVAVPQAVNSHFYFLKIPLTPHTHTQRKTILLNFCVLDNNIRALLAIQYLHLVGPHAHWML